MPEARKLSDNEVRVADVVVRDRLRPVYEAGLSALMASIAEHGFMMQPIHVRKVKHRGGQLLLIAGGHRLEAARRLGWETVPAVVWNCTDDQARMMEIDDNSAGAELSALDNAVFLAARKEVYERQHPETKAGTAGAYIRWGHASDMTSFASATAEKFGLSKRQVERIVSAGGALNPDEVRRLRGAPRPVTLNDLQAISKINSAPERYEVVDRLAEGRAKSAAEARRAWAKRDLPDVPLSPTDAAYLKLKTLWGQTTPTARRRFVEDSADELREMLVKIGGEA